jgi:hypothetical protein
MCSNRRLLTSSAVRSGYVCVMQQTSLLKAAVNTQFTLANEEHAHIHFVYGFCNDSTSVAIDEYW